MLAGVAVLFMGAKCGGMCGGAVGGRRTRDSFVTNTLVIHSGMMNASSLSRLSSRYDTIVYDTRERRYYLQETNLSN